MSTVAVQSRREAGKALRRRRIVEAARSLLAEVDFDSLSMVEIAARADVSPATLYNLFQTKAAIFHEIVERDFEDYKREVLALDATGPLDRIFLAIDFAASLYQREPDYYRATLRATVQQFGGELSQYRRRFWQDRVADAVAADELRQDVDVQLLGSFLEHITRGLYFDWMTGLIGRNQLARQANYGFALLMNNYVTAKSREFLLSHIRRLEVLLAYSESAGAPRSGPGDPPAA